LTTRSSAASGTASPVIAIAPGTSATPAFAWKRLALIVLLVSEILYLTVSFDTQSLGTAASVWTALVGSSSQYLRVAIAAVFVLLLLVATRIARPRAVVALGDTPVSSGWVAFHLTVFGAFVWLTGGFFAGAAGMAAHPAVSAATWLLVGMVMLASWAFAMYPRERWWTALVESRVFIAWSLTAGVAVWASRFLTETLWAPLARYTFSFVNAILQLLYAETVSRPERLIVGTPRFKVAISPECSGYEGIGLILGFLTIYLFLFRKELRFPSALVLLPIGAAAIWLLNVGRIVALIAIGTSGWPAVATGGFHSQAGWLAFNAVALGFVVLINRAGYFRTREERIQFGTGAELSRVDTASADSTTAYLGPFVAMLAAAMVTGAFSAGFDWLYGMRMMTALAALWACRAAYRRLDWRGSWQACAIGVATFAMWIALFPSTVSDASVWPMSLQSASTWAAGAWLVVRLIGYVLVVPVVEELAFRVYAMRRLTHRDIDAAAAARFSFSAFAISSLLFGALHGGLWVQGTLAGMAFAYAFYRRRRLGDAVVAHATTNGLIALYVFATGRWSVWS